MSDIELERAKNMLKSMMFMQLESRLVLCEDIARQFVTYGKRDSPLEYVQKIEKVTAEDIMRVAQRMFEKPPAVGAVGHNLSTLPKFELISDYTNTLRAQNPPKPEPRPN